MKRMRPIEVSSGFGLTREKPEFDDLAEQVGETGLPGQDAD